MDIIDSIIFDMDGTLWNALEIYTEAWNRSLRENGVQRILTAPEIADMTGWEKKDILSHLLPYHPEAIHNKVDQLVAEYSTSLIPAMKGQLYPGVDAGLSRLSERYPLFILSNCDAGVIDLFMDATGIRSLIVDYVAHGETGFSKHENMRRLMDMHRLHSPIYVGDTHRDSEESEKAGIPFIFLTYGFGQSTKYHKKFDSFEEFSTYYSSL